MKLSNPVFFVHKYFLEMVLLGQEITFFFFFKWPRSIWGFRPAPLHWQHGILTTGPPGKSQEMTFLRVLINIPPDFLLKGQSTLPRAGPVCSCYPETSTALGNSQTPVRGTCTCSLAHPCHWLLSFGSQHSVPYRLEFF